MLVLLSWVRSPKGGSGIPAVTAVHRGPSLSNSHKYLVITGQDVF